MTDHRETAGESDVVALVREFELERLLDHDQNDRRLALLGRLRSEQAILLVERAAFGFNDTQLRRLLASLTSIENLQANDIYHWYMASSSCSGNSNNGNNGEAAAAPASRDVKLTLIYPCTAQHIRKYAAQEARMVTETPAIYRDLVRGHMLAKREGGRLNWVYNILEGKQEADQVVHHQRSRGGSDEEKEGGGGGADGFLLMPDLNWDRETMGTLHLLALVERRDFCSIRDLRKKHVPWLKKLRDEILEATTANFPSIDKDQLRLYFHYQPTYYHMHIHVVNVMLEAGGTQSVGKAHLVDAVISQLESMAGDSETGMADVNLTYVVGEASELWTQVFGPLKDASETQAKVES